MTLNDPVYLEAAIHLAKDHLDSTVEGSIKKMYTAATYRTIDDAILSELLALYQKAIEELKDNNSSLNDFFELGEKLDPYAASLSIVANAIMNLDEFLTHG